MAISKRALFALAAIALIFLSGCVKVDSYEQFYQNGRSRVVTQIYEKNLINTLNLSGIEPPDSSSWQAYFENQCLQMQNSSAVSVCHISGDWLIFDDNRVSGEDFILTTYDAFPYTMYELTVLSPPLPPLGAFKNVGHFDAPESARFSDFNETTYSQLASSGMEYTYTISMPGEIIEASHGSTGYNTVTVNVLDVIRTRTPIRIKARELDFSQLFIVIFGGGILFLAFDLSMIWFLREWSKKKLVGDDLRRKRQTEEARRRVFRQDPRLHGNEVYMAPQERKKQDNQNQNGPNQKQESTKNQEGQKKEGVK
ncbi:MAG: hypothetical protein V1822_01745 [Candidatus Micrarchaeota archaeon]